MEEKQGNKGKFTTNPWSLNFWTPLNMDVLLDTIYLDRMDMKKETLFMPLWKMRKGDAISFLLSIPMIQVSNLKRCHGKTIVLMNEQLDSPYFRTLWYNETIFASFRKDGISWTIPISLPCYPDFVLTLLICLLQEASRTRNWMRFSSAAGG